MLFDYEEGKVEIRASFYVTVHGEKTVLCLLRHKHELIDIRSLGMPSRILNRFLEEALFKPSGVLLVTGSTGSGNTSTVYGLYSLYK